MDQAGREKKQGKARILVAPLDWGLGHATRCIPIIRELISQGAEPLLAAENAQAELLKTEFPDLKILPLAGYRVKYAKTPIGLLSNILFQTPRLIQTIKEENKWLIKNISEYSIDAVISDNRYGLSHPSIPCIFITHQLLIKTPFGKWSENILQKRNYRYINRFISCWVPDSPAGNNLAGELSHPAKKPAIPLSYLGNLSRFEMTGVKEIKDHLLVILSGPEPQRSILENKLLNEIAHYPATATIVRGLPGSTSIIPSTNMISFHNHLPAALLGVEMEKAEYVIGRSGYSSIMDLVKLKKKSILIPTPGQTEQEWLAGHLTRCKISLCISQKGFSLTEALKNAENFNYQIPSVEKNELLVKAVKEMLYMLK